MSSAKAAVRFKDGEIRFFRYFGTSDHCISSLFESEKAIDSAWKHEPRRECICGHPEPAEAFALYGGEWYFQVKACRDCMAIWVEGEDPYETETSESLVDPGWGLKALHVGAGWDA